MRHAVPPSRGTRGHRGRALLAASVLALTALGLACAIAPRADAATADRTALPSPNLYDIPGTPQPLDAGQQISLRVYLKGQDSTGLASDALAVSTPGNAAYGHFLTPAGYEQRYGPSAAQVQAVSDWLTGAGMTVTATTADYIAVQASVAQANAAFGTQVSDYQDVTTSTGKGGSTTTSTTHAIGIVGTVSVPEALGSDIATVTGIAQTTLPGGSTAAGGDTSPESTGAAANTTPNAAPAQAAAAPADSAGQDAGVPCSQYWGQHVTAIPEAYGHTTAPTQLCGYTAAQLRSAYGITGSQHTGKGATIAIVLSDANPTMLADANRFFASQGIAGFTPGQYTEVFDGNAQSDCSSQQDEDNEEPLDVETVHIAAPDAKVVYVGADCDLSEENWPLQVQDLLDATSRVVNQHLADVVSSSWGFDESELSPADIAAWDLTFQQGALEGIGFDYSSGDGGSIQPEGGLSSSAQFPAADPWVTAVGGTSLAIGKNGTSVAEYPWTDSLTQATADGTGYITPPPGDFISGSGGGISALFAQPAYQRPVVPAALATDGGQATPRRVVPDISANAGSGWLMGYTGAASSGVYGESTAGGTSGSAPLIAGLEADAIQAAGHPLGFANPALYQWQGSPAIRDITAVSPQDPPMLYGGSIYTSDGNDLTTIGLDASPLRATTGYDDVTGLGAATPSLVTAFPAKG